MLITIILSAIAGAFLGGIGYAVMKLFAVPDAGLTALAAGMMFFSILAMTIYAYTQRTDDINEQLDGIENTFPVKYLCRVNAEIKGRKFGRLYIFGDRFLLMSVLKKNIVTEHLPYNSVRKIDYMGRKPKGVLDLKIEMQNGDVHILSVINAESVIKSLTTVGWRFNEQSK